MKTLFTSNLLEYPEKRGHLGIVAARASLETPINITVQLLLGKKLLPFVKLDDEGNVALKLTYEQAQILSIQLKRVTLAISHLTALHNQNLLGENAYTESPE